MVGQIDLPPNVAKGGCKPTETQSRKWRLKMKQRTIEELHDKYIGHRKFAKVVDGLIANSYKITDIKEYNEHFKFKVDGIELHYMKDWKASAQQFIKWVEQTLDFQKQLEELQK